MYLEHFKGFDEYQAENFWTHILVWDYENTIDLWTASSSFVEQPFVPVLNDHTPVDCKINQSPV